MTYEKFGWILNFWNLARSAISLFFIDFLYSCAYRKSFKFICYTLFYFSFLILLFLEYFKFIALLMRMRERGIIIKGNELPNFYLAKLINSKLFKKKY